MWLSIRPETTKQNSGMKIKNLFYSIFNDKKDQSSFVYWIDPSMFQMVNILFYHNKYAFLRIPGIHFEAQELY